MAADDGYRVVPYHPDLRSGILRLQRELWGPDQDLNDAYLTWKHETNPYLPSPRIYVATLEGEPVGMRGLMGSCWEASGLENPTVLLCAGDLVIAPAHRRSGLFPRMMQYIRSDLAASGIPYLLNLSGSRTTRLLSLQSGWRSAGSLGLWCRRGQSRNRSELDPFRELDQASSEPELARAGLQVTTRPDPGGMAELVARLEWDGRLRQVRDPQYLRWRFNNPRADYRFCYLGQGGIQAYLVLQHKRARQGYPVRVIDWEGETTEARRTVLAALRFCDGPLDIRCSNLSRENQALLREAGFVERPSRSVTDDHNAILVDRISAQGESERWVLGERDILAFQSWDFREVYSDGV